MATVAAPDETPEQRAERRRRTWSIRQVPVDGAMLASESTMEARVARMYQLSIDPWALRGEALPRYLRAEMPGRIISVSEHDD